MRVKVDQDAVIAAIRDIVNDDIGFTSPELVKEFTMTDVAAQLGTTRRAVRNAFNTISEAADGVRLKEMDRFFDRVGGAGHRIRHARQDGPDVRGRPGREPLEPQVRFRTLCDQLIGPETFRFFLDSGPVFQEFERRVVAGFTEILNDGTARQTFNVPSIPGAAQFAFDVLRVLAIEAQALDHKIVSLAFLVSPTKLALTYDNHVDLILRSWGSATVDRLGGAETKRMRS